MNLDLSIDEMRLARLALERLRREIDVEGPSKLQTMNDGQRTICRYAMPDVDHLIERMTYKETNSS